MKAFGSPFTPAAADSKTLDDGSHLGILYADFHRNRSHLHSCPFNRHLKDRVNRANKRCSMRPADSDNCIESTTWKN